MKKLSKIKLNAMAEDNLANREMNALKGGMGCWCGCCYANNGGSSDYDNGVANSSGNLRSKGYCGGGGYYIGF